MEPKPETCTPVQGDGADAPDFPPVKLDMDAVIREAAGPLWIIEFDSDGIPFTWTGRAHSQALADERARSELVRRDGRFSVIRATVVAISECTRQIGGQS